MGILDLFKRKQEEIYCQACGTQITDDGGDVSSNGNVYCHGYKEDRESRCFEKEIFEDMVTGRIPVGAVIVNYYSPRQIQKAIRKKGLVRFGPLEIEADSK